MLELNQLSKIYGKKRALDQMNFCISPGERVALLGSNGSGKTTVIRSICRLLNWESGDILFEGKSIVKNRDYLRKIGAVLEGSRNLNWRLTSIQNAYYFAALRGIKTKAIKSAVDDMTVRLGLEQYKQQEVGQLSTGNRQKSALLCALAHEPELLMLDEPTLGLDIETVQKLAEIISEQAQENNQGFLITSHDFMFIDKICTRVVLIDQGKLVFDGGIKELKQKLFHYELRISLDEHQLIALTEQKEQLWSQANKYHQVNDNKQFIMQYDQPSQALPSLNWLDQKGFKPKELTIKPLTVEMAYQSIINPDTQSCIS